MGDIMDAIIAKCHECGAKNRIAAGKQHLRPRCGKCGAQIEISGVAVPVAIGDNTMDSFINSVKLPVMVDFFSPTCGPCTTLMPFIDAMAGQYLGKVIIAKVDTSRNPGCAAHYRIKGVPTLIFFKSGRVVEEMVGLPDKIQLRAKLDYYSS
jgi:thioredoxin 2